MRPRLLIFVPGFPGEAIPRAEGETRVVDIVTEVSKKNNIPLELIKYPGIINDDGFTFEKTQLYTFIFIKEKIELGYSITLIGQSWGGLLSLLALDQFCIDRLLLITPFVLSLKDLDIHNILQMYSREFPILIPPNSISSNTKEVANVLNLLKKLPQKEKLISDIRVLAAIEDEIIPINSLREYFKKTKAFKNPVLITEIKNDHVFSYGKTELTHWLNLNV